jgi:hypothetical protein
MFSILDHKIDLVHKYPELLDVFNLIKYDWYFPGVGSFYVSGIYDDTRYPNLENGLLREQALYISDELDQTTTTCIIYKLEPGQNLKLVTQTHPFIGQIALGIYGLVNTPPNIRIEHINRKIPPGYLIIQSSLQLEINRSKKETGILYLIQLGTVDIQSYLNREEHARKKSSQGIAKLSYASYHPSGSRRLLAACRKATRRDCTRERVCIANPLEASERG